MYKNWMIYITIHTPTWYNIIRFEPEFAQFLLLCFTLKDLISLGGGVICYKSGYIFILGDVKLYNLPFLDFVA